MSQTRLAKLQAIKDWELSKPKTDKAWADDTKKENLDIHPDSVLSEMETSHKNKLKTVEKTLDKFNNWPQVVKYELSEKFQSMFADLGNPDTVEKKTLQQWVDQEFEEQKVTYEWKVAKLKQSCERIEKERALRSGKKVSRKDQSGNVLH